jgi:hypothetical protein
MIVFLTKVFLLSALISLGIRYLAPLLDIPGTPIIALTLVLSPTLLIAIVLAWRWYRFMDSQS